MCRMLLRVCGIGGSKGTLIDIFLVIGLIVMCFVFLKRHSIQRYASGKSPSQATQSGDSNERRTDEPKDRSHYQAQMKLEGKEIGDMRSKICITQKYSIDESVSLIIDFNDYQFINVKTTLTSILSVETERIAEIIIVDDGSTLEYIIKECDAFIKTIPKARLLRQANQLGQLRSRVAAMSIAKSDIVVFVDVNVICSRGWLDPLIDMLIKHPRYIAVPHHDLIRDPVSMEYQKTSRNLVASWAWTLAIKMKYTVDERIHNKTQYIMSPAVRGNAFAVRKRFLNSIGSLDESYEDGGGEYLDLSLKTWLCDGAVMVAACSHVGVLNLNTPLKIQSRKNMKHIVEKYFGERSEAVLRVNKFTGHQSAPIKHPNILPDMIKCKTIDWYLTDVKNETNTPSNSVVEFGALKSNSGSCIRININDSKADLFGCDNDPREGAMELTSSGRILTADKQCLTTQATAYIVAEPCRMNDTHQAWTYNARRELVNAWSGFCMRHVTDPDKNNARPRQIAMAQACDVAQEQPRDSHFKQWTFITN